MEENKFRCHFSIIFEEIYKTLIFAVTFFISLLIGDDSLLEIGGAGDIKFLLYLMAAVAIFISLKLILEVLKWKKTIITLDDEMMIISRNTINKKVNNIAIATISNINFEQNLFERIIGTCKLKIDTNSLSTANETDIKIVLKKQKATDVKNRILNQLEKDSRTTEMKVEADNEYDVDYSFGQIIMHSLYSVSISTIIVFGFIAAPAFFEIASTLKPSSGRNILSILKMFFYAAIIVVPIVYSAFKSFFKYYGFKAARKDNEIFISYGLFNKRKYTIPVDKINAVVIDEPLMGRLFKRRNVEIINIGMGDDENEGAQLLLSCTKDEYLKKMKILLPEVALADKLIKQNKEVGWIIAAQFLVVMMFSGIIAYFTTIYLFFGIMAAALFIFIMRYLNAGLDLGEKYLAISNGIVRKRTKYMQYEKIQYIKINQGPIGKILKISRGNVFILASILNMVHSIGYYDNKIFDEIADKI